MVVSAPRDHSLPLLLIGKYVLNLLLGLGLLGYLVQAEYKLEACLGALKVYSLAVLVLQSVYRVLPDTSTHQGVGADGIASGFGKGKSRNKGGKLVDFFLVVIFSIFSICLTHIVTVLYGAYLIENIEETFTLSTLVASLAFIRPLIAFGPGAISILIERAGSEEESEIQTLAILLGAWFGALPIPLDWDTPWQVWPLTCSIGAVFGEIGASAYFLAKLYKVADSNRKKNKST